MFEKDKMMPDVILFHSNIASGQSVAMINTLDTSCVKVHYITLSFLVTNEVLKRPRLNRRKS